ncbi:hypothetical protein AVEN_222930-1 [Araneus ventricosus]|uniref:Uncharacterized protein n=1 Tax=Araneus ventricosus TaxID=182803 RepID=A0A4Y2VR31_ARAVE|nr:hypothetical protein AVEN_268955-1 [Araneus ventricosus]GBO26211.1 hypothetical protein AVEN_222930-1 [Araneus ventricosus]
MALLVNSGQLLNFLAVIILTFSDYAVSITVIEAPYRLDPACACEPQPKEWNTPVSDKVASFCPQCFVFTYDFKPDQPGGYKLNYGLESLLHKKSITFLRYHGSLSAKWAKLGLVHFNTEPPPPPIDSAKLEDS